MTGLGLHDAAVGHLAVPAATLDHRYARLWRWLPKGCLIAMLILVIAPGMAVAGPEAFWLPTDEGKQLSPSPAPKSIVPGIGEPPKLGFDGYPGRPPPKVPPRKHNLDFYPCSQCHQYRKSNTQPRQLAPVHEVGLEHGRGQLWCVDCHDPENSDALHTVRGEQVDIDESWRVCSQCHSSRGRDWYFGAHGKRVYNWQGEAERYDCTHCHNPHRPPFMERTPQPPPPVRAGLQPMPRHQHRAARVWETDVAHSPEAEDVQND